MLVYHKFYYSAKLIHEEIGACRFVCYLIEKKPELKSADT
jgi:hypothetical protein